MLLLDPNTAIVPSQGWLYVFNRKGLTKIQARYIDEVHEKLKAYLDGTHDESELMAAVPVEKQSILKKYFEAMEQAGALHRGEPAKTIVDLTVHESVDRQHGRSLVVTLNGKSVLVSLDGKDYSADDRGQPFDGYLLFVTPSQMNDHWSRVWNAQRSGPHLIYVVEEASSGQFLSEAVIEKRKRYATWLLGCSRMESWNTRTLQLYTFDAGAFALTPRFAANLGRGNRENTSRLDLVTPTDHEQIPLVIAKAAAPFCSNSVVGCGLQYSQLSEEMEREFVVQAVLTSAVQRGKLSFATEFRNWQYSRTALRRTYVDPRQALEWAVAGSLLQLRVLCLERFCWKLPALESDSSRGEIDLLQQDQKHPQVGFLASVLRRRLHTLPAIINLKSSGLYVCQSGQYLAYSFVEAKAMRDALLAAAKDVFYGDSLSAIKTKHECDFTSFLTEDGLQQINLQQNEMLDRQKVTRKFAFKHIQRHGLSAWVGNLSHGN
ncbi:MAG TPA: hypothetical protein VG649_15995 [Candidatus Angelobacter sp.]|jgi:hypothetical protein|nr:hypothetical protein [Candidatus Angelobacter sp.]